MHQNGDASKWGQNGGKMGGKMGTPIILAHKQNGDTHNSWQVSLTLSRLEWSL